MSVVIARGFNPVTKQPLGVLDLYRRNGNNAISSLGLGAEGGTLNQSFFINSLSEKPFDIKSIHCFQDEDGKYATDIQVYCSPQTEFVSPVGDPRLKFYLLSPSESERVSTLHQSISGDTILVDHMTYDEYINDFDNSIVTYHSDGTSVADTPINHFIESFTNILNIGTYAIDGTLTYKDLYYNNPSNSGVRHMYSVLIYAELPYNNINLITTNYPIRVNASVYSI